MAGLQGSVNSTNNCPKPKTSKTNKQISTRKYTQSRPIQCWFSIKFCSTIQTDFPKATALLSVTVLYRITIVVRNAKINMKYHVSHFNVIHLQTPHYLHSLINHHKTFTHKMYIDWLIDCDNFVYPTVLAKTACSHSSAAIRNTLP